MPAAQTEELLMKVAPLPINRREGGFPEPLHMGSQSNDNQHSAVPQNSMFAVCHKQQDLTHLAQCVSQAIESMKVVP